MTPTEVDLEPLSLKRLTIVAALVIVVGLGSVLGWASVAEVSSAVPAVGTFISSGKRKTVAVMEGGTLKEMFVREGDHVIAGQPLFRFDDVQIQATRNQAKLLFWAAVARATRLEAEAAGRRELSLPDDLVDAAKTDGSVDAAIAAEGRQFQARWSSFDAAVKIQERKVAQIMAQTGAIRAQIASSGIKLQLTEEDLRNTEYLLARGLSTKPRQLELLRTQAETRGQIGQLGSQLTQSEQAIAQTELETLNLGETRRTDIARERSETQAVRMDAEQRLFAATDQLEKRVVRAPEAGIISDIRFYTVGSSITGGQSIMDLVPEDQRLVIEGNVVPSEIAHLSVGQPVNIRLTAYKAHKVPVITGKLTYVGADRQLDGNNQPFFLIRGEVNTGDLADKPGVTLLPGMPADILVIGTKRSVLSYLVSPLTDSLFHAMTEE